MGIWTRWQPVVQNIVFTETYAVPLAMEEKRPLLEKIPEGREYLKYFDTTPEEFVLRHFEHPRVRAFIAFLGVMRGFELDAPQTGYLIPAMIAWGVNPQLCRGTSHALGDNLAHMVDDTCYFIPCQSQEEAELLLEMLSSASAKEFLNSLVFPDSKRPVTAEVLRRLSFTELARELGKLDHLQRFVYSDSATGEGQAQMSLLMESKQEYRTRRRCSQRAPVRA